MMRPLADLHPRVRVLVVVSAAVGALVTAAAWTDVLDDPGPARLLPLLAVVAVVLVGDISLLRIRVGHNGDSFTWAEAAVIVGVAIGGWPWLLALAAPTVLARQLAVGRSAHKALFNAGSVAVGAYLASLAYLLVAGDRGIDLREGLTWQAGAGLMLAVTVYFLVVGWAVSCAVGWSQQISPVAVWRRGLRLRLLMFVGNSAAGIAVVAIGGWNRPTVLVMPFFFLLLYLTYNAYLRAQQARDVWRDLYDVSLALSRTDRSAVVAATRHGAEVVLGAEVSRIVTDTDRNGDGFPALLRLGAAGTDPVTVDVRHSDAGVRHDLARLGASSAVLVPLGSQARLGVLVLGFRGPERISSQELRVLATFANHAAISIQRADLFEEVSAERARLSAIVDNASDGIVLVHRTGIVRSWNAAMGAITGRDAAEAVGCSIAQALNARCEDGQPLTSDLLFGRLMDADHFRLDVTVSGRQRRTRDVSLSVSAVSNSAGTCDHAVIVGRDVTAQRDVEHAKQDFIATVSHELRTPLTPIKGFLATLLRPDFHPDPALQETMLRQMLDQADRMERLVEDLLSVSRLQRGQFAIAPEVVNVDAVVTAAARDLQASVPRRIERDGADGQVLSVCDPARLQQVLANLLWNAHKYSPPEWPVHVGVRRLGKAVEFTVRDHGPGIPEDAREAVFEPFHRLGDHMTRGIQGTGLGLHIARQLVEAMDGLIWVDDAPEGGAAFHITLPAVVDHEPALPLQSGDPLAAHSVIPTA
jgi:PAS domain S-box-containing protein